MSGILIPVSFAVFTNFLTVPKSIFPLASTQELYLDVYKRQAFTSFEYKINILYSCDRFYNISLQCFPAFPTTR